jgi:hypothetical protein
LLISFSNFLFQLYNYKIECVVAHTLVHMTLVWEDLGSILNSNPGRHFGGSLLHSFRQQTLKRCNIVMSSWNKSYYNMLNERFSNRWKMKKLTEEIVWSKIIQSVITDVFLAKHPTSTLKTISKNVIKPDSLVLFS